VIKRLIIALAAPFYYLLRIAWPRLISSVEIIQIMIKTLKTSAAINSGLASTAKPSQKKK
jgi:hypothetical protein